MCFTFPLFTNFSVSKDSWIKGFIYLFIYLVEKKKFNEEQHINIVSKYIPTDYLKNYYFLLVINKQQGFTV